MQYNFNEPQRYQTQQPYHRPAPRARSAPRSYPRIAWGLAIGSILAAVVFFTTHVWLFELPSIVSIVLAYLAFTFSASLIFRGSVPRVILEFVLSHRLTWPGLIWELSTGGCLWFFFIKFTFFLADIAYFLILKLPCGLATSILVSSVSYYFDLARYIRVVKARY